MHAIEVEGVSKAFRVFTERNQSVKQALLRHLEKVFVHGGDCLAISDRSRAGHYHPMFGALFMALQAEPGAGCDFNALDLEAIRIFFQHRIVAPRPVYLHMINMFGRALLLQRIHHFAHALRLVTSGNQHRIGSLDHAQVFHPDCRNQPLFCADQTVLAPHRDDITLQRIAVLVFGRNFVHSLPATDIVPADITGNKRDTVRLFQHTIVDRNGRHGSKVFLYRLLKRYTGAAVGQYGLHNLVYCRQVFFYFSEDHRSTPYEHAGVPVVIAFAEEAFGSGEIGFFGETFYCVNFLSVANPP